MLATLRSAEYTFTRWYAASSSFTVVASMRRCAWHSKVLTYLQAQRTRIVYRWSPMISTLITFNLNVIFWILILLSAWHNTFASGFTIENLLTLNSKLSELIKQKLKPINFTLLYKPIGEQPKVAIRDGFDWWANAKARHRLLASVTTVSF